jgi:hypothetical protein
MLSRTPPTVLGVLVHRVRSASGAYGSCPWSGNAGAVSLTPRSHRCGLDAPMPLLITPVSRGRCRPSPDRVPQGAPSDRHGGCVVARGLSVLARQWLLPVLSAPPGGVGGVYGDDSDAEFGRHGHEPGPQPGRGQAGDQLAEAFAVAGLLPGLLRGEVEVLDRDGEAVAFGPVQEADQGVAYLGVPVGGGAGQVVVDAGTPVSLLVSAPAAGRRLQSYVPEHVQVLSMPSRSAFTSARLP